MCHFSLDKIAEGQMFYLINAISTIVTIDSTDSLPQVFLHSLVGVKKPTETALTHPHRAVKLSTDTVTNEIVLGGLAAP